MIAKPGHKWIIIMTLPSGSKFACAGHEGKFALIPIGKGDKEVKLTNVLAFDTIKDAAEWMKKFTAQMNPTEKKAFMDMKPEIGQVAISQ